MKQDRMAEIENRLGTFEEYEKLQREVQELFNKMHKDINKTGMEQKNGSFYENDRFDEIDWMSVSGKGLVSFYRNFPQ